ncbi:uncharacterized protein CPUR_06182 [Claviceps purpurea 20.1]|uniref:Uncharacterized protein n=1 Tax=Claviceps purpurea (strain 20.1) TaxID=1111077 RepID=M1VX33_CLAP2|nr:uncharacterized protein CPUR_06182 [Claviceps purpurea 20.1]
MGGQNCHAEITFEDGVVWLARFRVVSAVAPPPEVCDYTLQSEATTMQFLERHTRVPSPRVFDWACESDPTNTIGVGYILMEKLNGTSLHWPSATAAQREKIVRQYADIMLEIERHPFDQLGSLISKGAAAESQIQVGALADFTTFRSGDGGTPLGPFRSSKEVFRAFVEASIRMIVSGEVGRAETELDIILAYKFGLDVVDRVSEQSVTAYKGSEQFFLKHMDDKGDHILVNDDFDIVGIIDWEWCQTAPREQAFSSPQMMWPIKAFFDGSNELAEEELLLARVFRERGREDLASCVLHGRKVQRLLYALGPMIACEDRKTLAGLFMGLKRAFDEHDIKTDGQGVEDEWETWKAKALEDWKHEALIETALEANGQLVAAHHVGAHIAV